MIEAIDWEGMMKVAPVIGVMAIAIIKTEKLRKINYL